ncbi:MAG: O-antigen ligase family protein [Verrucomicrobiota bacterium]
MDRERLDLLLERIILGLVLSILVFSTLALGGVRGDHFSIVLWLTAVVVGFWVARLWIAPKITFLWPPACWAVLGFAIYAVLRYHYSDIEYVARQEVLQILVYTTVFFVIVNNLYRQENSKIVVMSMVGLAMLLSFYAMYQAFGHSNKVWAMDRPLSYANRGSGTFFCPNSLAGFLEMLLPVAVMSAFSRRSGHAARIILGYAAMVILAGIAVTYSRGGWVACAVALTLLLIFGTRNIRARLIILVILLGLTVGGYYSIKQAHRVVQRRVGEAMNMGHDRDLRYRIWPAAAELWLNQPWWGVGPAHFDHRFPPYRDPVNRMQARPVYVHNDFLNTLTDYGVVGFALMGAVWFLVFVGASQTWNRMSHATSDGAALRSSKSAFVAGAALGLIAILVHSLVDFNLHIPANALLAVTLMAFLTTYMRFATEQYWVPLATTGRAVATLVLIAAFFLLGVGGVRRFTEAYWLRQASRSTLAEEKLGFLQKAFLAEPQNFETAHEIGEVYRLISWDGNDDWAKYAEAALPWYRQSMILNPYFSHAPMRYGMCLDWLKRPAEALPWFQHALTLDPNSYFMVGSLGWHYMQTGQYAIAKRYFERSVNLNFENNAQGWTYLQWCEREVDAQRRGIK